MLGLGLQEGDDREHAPVGIGGDGKVQLLTSARAIVRAGS